MQLSRESITEYKEMRRRYHGDELTPEQAEREANELLRLIAAIQDAANPGSEHLSIKLNRGTI